MKVRKAIMKTTNDIKINQILLFNVVEFTHLSSSLGPCCLIAKLPKCDLGKHICYVLLKFVLKSVSVALCCKS